MVVEDELVGAGDLVEDVLAVGFSRGHHTMVDTQTLDPGIEQVLGEYSQTGKPLYRGPRARDGCERAGEADANLIR